MKLLSVLHRILPRVELRVIEHLSTDLRDPWQLALRAHKLRRLHECHKVPVATTFAPELPGFLRRQAD